MERALILPFDEDNDDLDNDDDDDDDDDVDDDDALSLRRTVINEISDSSNHNNFKSLF